MSQSVIEWEILRMFPSDKFDEFDRLVRQEIIRLQPRKPEDGTSFFIAYNAGDKRMKMKTGRFLTRKLGLLDVMPEHTVQVIAERINTVLFTDKISIELVNGGKITQHYKEVTGVRSCMSGIKADCTLLYEMNPDRFQMLVMRLNGDSARAIVHRLDCGKHYMDRIYSSSSTLTNLMETHAIQQGWMTREQHDPKMLVVSGLKWRNGHIPYMDTLNKFRIEDDGLMTIGARLPDWHGILDHEDGLLGEPCTDCGEYGDPADMTITYDGYVCESCLEDYACCCQCGDFHSIQDMIMPYESDNGYCPACTDRYLTTCDNCGDIYRIDVLYSVGDEQICNFCLEHDYINCDVCENTVANDLIETVDGTGEVCNKCLLEHFTRCAVCEDYTPNEHVRQIGDVAMCVDCFSKHAQCACCGHATPADRTFSTADGPVCIDCYLAKYAMCQICHEITRHENGQCLKCAGVKCK